MDVIGAAAGLVLSAPLAAFAALGVWLTMGRPILFRQVRGGLHGRPFTIVKFRTMIEAPGLPDAARITPFGRWLRATSLDELPQLTCVLWGTMSLVGPRPHRIEYLTHFAPQYHRRHEVKPGLTGLAQVEGRNALSWTERLERDVWYVDHRWWGLDAWIVLRTIPVVLSRRGVDPPDQFRHLTAASRDTPPPTGAGRNSTTRRDPKSCERTV